MTTILRGEQLQYLLYHFGVFVDKIITFTIKVPVSISYQFLKVIMMLLTNENPQENDVFKSKFLNRTKNAQIQAGNWWINFCLLPYAKCWHTGK